MKPEPKIFSALITGMSHDCRGITHINGKTTFIDNALPEEEVSFFYTAKHHHYDEGIATKIVKNSPHRVTPSCPYFHCCGGCSLQHIAPEAQISAKTKILWEQLQHFGHTIPPASLPPLTGPVWNYRSRARLSVKNLTKKNKVLVGFHEKNGRFVAEIEQCLILEKVIGEKITLLKELIASLSISSAIPQIEVAGGDHVTALIFRHLLELAPSDRQKLIEFGDKHNLQIYLQPEGLESIHNILNENMISESAPIDESNLGIGGDGEEQTTGMPSDIPEAENSERRSQPSLKPKHQRYISTQRPGNHNLSYKLPDFNVELFFGASDFTQINKIINQKLVTRVKEILAPEPCDHILDLFCGLGNFTIPLAQFCAKIVGVEGSIQMVERAKDNARHNGIDNAEFYSADLTRAWLGSDPLSWTQRKFNKIILDPPRTGALEIVQQIKKFNAKKIIYISCNPATFARDTEELSKQGYKLLRAGVIDMFPHTKHTEAMGEFILSCS